MEVIEIGATQLIFLLDQKEMVKYNINSTEGSPRMKEGFQRLICDHGVSHDFLSHVLVQIFDSKSGGCEMFVTKLPCRQDLNGNAEEQVNKFVYIFPDVDCLTSACKMLYDIPLRGGSAYYDKAGGKYYLVLNGDIPYISEFRAKRCNDPAEEYLCEYCKMISDKAVERLSSLA